MVAPVRGVAFAAGLLLVLPFGFGHADLPSAVARCEADAECGWPARGACVSGKCTCGIGFKGRACELCDANRLGAACTVQCSFPLSCNGHGRCSGLDGTCICATGWSGPQCASDDDMGSVSNNETASEIVINSTTGMSSVGTTAAWSTPVPTPPQAFCATSEDCGGAARGACVSGVCVCQDGFRGDRCESCAEGQTGQNCSVTCRFPWACSGHGRCEGVTGVCLCEAGWSGPDCELQQETTSAAAELTTSALPATTRSSTTTQSPQTTPSGTTLQGTTPAATALLSTTTAWSTPVPQTTTAAAEMTSSAVQTTSGIFTTQSPQSTPFETTSFGTTPVAETSTSAPITTPPWTEKTPLMNCSDFMFRNGTICELCNMTRCGVGQYRGGARRRQEKRTGGEDEA